MTSVGVVVALDDVVEDVAALRLFAAVLLLLLDVSLVVGFVGLVVAVP